MKYKIYPNELRANILKHLSIRLIDELDINGKSAARIALEEILKGGMIRIEPGFNKNQKERKLVDGDNSFLIGGYNTTVDFFNNTLANRINALYIEFDRISQGEYIKMDAYSHEKMNLIMKERADKWKDLVIYANRVQILWDIYPNISFKICKRLLFSGSMNNTSFNFKETFPALKDLYLVELQSISNLYALKTLENLRKFDITVESNEGYLKVICMRY